MGHIWIGGHEVFNKVTFEAEVDNTLYSHSVYQSAEDDFDLSSINPVSFESEQENSFHYVFPITKNWLRSFGYGDIDLKGNVSFDSYQSNDLLAYVPVMFSTYGFNNLMATIPVEPSSIRTLARVIYDPNGVKLDVTDKILSINIQYSLNSFCGQCDITWADWTIYDYINASDLNISFGRDEDVPTGKSHSRRTPKEMIEVWTKEGTGGTEYLQGRFFIEKRTTSVAYNQTVPSTWGRSRQAVLTIPFAPVVTRTWIVDTGAKTIAEEICAEYSPSDMPVELDWRIADYTILGYNLEVQDTRPIDLISQLASVVGGVLTASKDGKLVVVYRYGT